MLTRKQLALVHIAKKQTGMTENRIPGSAFLVRRVLFQGSAVPALRLLDEPVQGPGICVQNQASTHPTGHQQKPPDVQGPGYPGRHGPV